MGSEEIHTATAREAPLSAPSEQVRFESFLERLAAMGRRDRTLYAYRKDWEAFAAWYAHANGEPFDLTRLTALDVADYKKACLTQRHTPATVNRRLILVKRYAGYGLERGEVTAERLATLRAVPRVRVQTLAPKSLDRPQARRLLKEVELRASPRDKALVLLMLYSGLRVGEVVRLERGDVTISPKKGSILIRAKIAKGGKQRQVPLPLAARTALTEYFTSRRDRSAALFVGQRGPLHEDAVARVLMKYARHADLHISPHTLRHTFAFTYLERNANDLIGLANILGHENLQTTRIYTQKRLEDLQVSVENVQYY